MKFVKKSVLLLLIACTLFAFSCSTSVEPEPEKKVATVSVTDVTLDVATASIEEMSTKKLNATVTPTNATNKSVTWTSSNTAVAVVSNSGVVTAVAAGSAVITVTTADGNKTATAEITVTAATKAYISATNPEVYEDKVNPDISSTTADWGSGSEITKDSGIITSKNGTGWGNVSVVAFTNLSAGKLSEYAALVFSVNMNDFSVKDKITVKIPETEKSYLLANAIPLEDGWYKVTVPFTDFTTEPLTAVEFGIFQFGSGDILIKDVYLVGQSTDANKTLLETAISSATTKVESAVPGSEDGNYPQSAIDTLNAAIDTAKTVRDSSASTQAAVNTATATLKQAITTFDDSKITRVLVIPAQSSGDGLRLNLDTMALGTLPIINTSAWGGGSTVPAVVNDTANSTKAVVYTFSSETSWYGCPWQGDDRIDVSAYDTLMVRYNDSYLDHEVNTAVIQLVSNDGTNPAVTKNFQIAAGDFPGTISAADENGWKTLTISLSDFTGVDLENVFNVQFTNQAYNPLLPDTPPYNLNGKFYISEVKFYTEVLDD